MKIFVRVKPRASVSKVKKIGDTHFEVWVKAPAEKGKANKALIKALSKHFNISPSSISILSGFKSRKKVVEIEKK